MLISIYPNATSRSEGSTVELKTFLTSQKHRLRIQDVRIETVKEIRNTLKKQLPAATISGVFNERKIEGIKTYNGIVCLDYDGQDNPGIEPSKMKQDLSQFDETYYAGLSVSGTGVFAVIKTDNDNPEQHSLTVQILGDLIARHTGLQYDKACKDVSRLRFVSFDENPVLNEDAKVFSVKKMIQKRQAEEDARPPRPLCVRQYAPKNSHTNRDKVESLINTIQNQRINIAEDYTTWCNIGFALAGEFGTEGEQYFHDISNISPKYNQTEVSKKYENLRKTSSGRITIATFFQICIQNGVKI